MKIKSAAVLGAGAVGSYIIGGLTNKEGIEFGVIAEGERAERLKKQGCLINGTVYRPNVWTPEEAHGVDLIIVSLKYGALRGALPAIKSAVGENTIVMSLMNGVDSEEIISEVIDKSHILYSLIKIASRKFDNGYCFVPETTMGIILGEPEVPYESERVKAVEELFEGTFVRTTVTDCIIEEIWCKFRLNVRNNLPQAILRAGVGCYRDSEHMRAISDGLKAEVEAIAIAKGIDMSKIKPTSSHGTAVKPSAFYSTLQDLEAHRHTEIDMFAGAVVRMGKELGIPTPYNEYTYHMIKAIEEKNDGLFDYDDSKDEVMWSKS